jgi:hypothetical protein
MKSTKRSKRPKWNSSAIREDKALPTEAGADAEVQALRAEFAAAVNETSDTIWDDAVSEGKKIVAELDHQWWRLAELADQVTTEYGAKTVANFAQQIGAVGCTLERRLSVFRAWKTISAVPPESYAVAQALQAHPDRGEIIKANPNTTTAEARQKMREWRGDQTEAEEQDEEEDDQTEEEQQEEETQNLQR